MGKTIHDDINSFVVNLITFSGIYDIDKDGCVVYLNDEKEYSVDDRVTINGPTGPKYLVPYSENITQVDAIVINPFVEGIGDSIEKKWFYTIQVITVAAIVKRIFKFIIKTIIDNKKQKSVNMSDDLIKLIQPYLDQVDEKTLEEFELLTKDKGRESIFFNIHYTKSNRTASCYSAVLDPEFGTSQEDKKLRKKTRELFTQMMKDLFSEDLSTFKYQSKNKYCPKLDAMLNVMWNVLFAIQDKSMLSGKLYDLTFFTEHLGNLEEYHMKTRWLKQPTSVQSADGTDKASGQIIKTENPPWYAEHTNWSSAIGSMSPKRYTIPGVNNFSQVSPMNNNGYGGYNNNPYVMMPQQQQQPMYGNMNYQSSLLPPMNNNINLNVGGYASSMNNNFDSNPYGQQQSSIDPLSHIVKTSPI